MAVSSLPAYRIIIVIVARSLFSRHCRVARATSTVRLCAGFDLTKKGRRGSVAPRSGGHSPHPSGFSCFSLALFCFLLPVVVFFFSLCIYKAFLFLLPFSLLFHTFFSVSCNAKCRVVVLVSSLTNQRHSLVASSPLLLHFCPPLAILPYPLVAPSPIFFFFSLSLFFLFPSFVFICRSLLLLRSQSRNSADYRHVSRH